MDDRDEFAVRRKKLLTIDVTSWTSMKGNKEVAYAALELWVDGVRVDDVLFGPHENEDVAWDEATTIFWDTNPDYVLEPFVKEALS